MATFTVTNNTGSGAGSLRQAILDANAAAGADTIVFDAGLAGQTILLGGSRLPTVTESLTITGLGADKLTISAGRLSEILDINDGNDGVLQTVRISGLTLTEGRNMNLIRSAGISSSEALTVDGVAFTSVLATSSPTTYLASLHVRPVGTLTVLNSSFADNHALFGPAAIVGSGALTISNSTFYNNSGQEGGAVGGSNNVTIDSSTFVNNTSAVHGGAVALASGTIRNSIFAGSAVVNSQGQPLDQAIYSAGATTVSYSLMQGSASGVTFDNSITGAAANAFAPGAATVVGGLTVVVPQGGSIVQDRGDPAYTPGATVDQLGAARVFNGRIDMGAVEVQSVLVIPPAAPTTPTAPTTPPTVAPAVSANGFNVLGRPGTGVNAPPATVTTPTGQVLPNPILEQQKAIQALIARVDAGQLTLRAAQDIIVDMADATTSVASMSYQFFTGSLPTKAGLDYLVSSPGNPNDLNDGYYAGMSLENRYINFAVNLGKLGEGAADFTANYGGLSLTDATTKAYTEIFGAPAAGKVAAILTPERSAYFLSLGGDALGQKAAMVGWLLGEAAKSDLGPYAARNENFLYDLLDGTAAFGADAAIYQNAGPITVGLVGTSDV